ncbi:MAG: hypothetical protein JW861_01955 [Bacteroidales bacterium]|nr:hypothetical protein [Bacteroidales bacterium]
MSGGRFIWLLPVVLGYASLTVTAQKEGLVWYFGDLAGLDFRPGYPVPLSDGALSTIEGCATISDSEGQLLFYTDGITVFNRKHQVMQGGTGLFGDPSGIHYF